MAQGKKVAKKTASAVKGKSVSKMTSAAEDRVHLYSRSGSKKNKIPDRRSKEYRERLNRATKLVIDLHREALKDLEKH